MIILNNDIAVSRIEQSYKPAHDSAGFPAYDVGTVLFSCASNGNEPN